MRAGSAFALPHGAVCLCVGMRKGGIAAVFNGDLWEAVAGKTVVVLWAAGITAPVVRICENTAERMHGGDRTV